MRRQGPWVRVIAGSGSLDQPLHGDVDLLANLGLAAIHLGDDTVVHATWPGCGTSAVRAQRCQ